MIDFNRQSENYKFERLSFDGRPISDQSNEEELQDYEYNGKEMDRMYGLDWLDYGARMDNPATGLWTQVDPLAEKYYHINPYLYCAGNPVRYVDPDGREWKYYTDDKGNIHISVDIKLTYSGKAINLAGFEKALSSLFNAALSNASNGRITGDVTYNGYYVEGKVTPEMILDFGGGRIAGSTYASGSYVNIADRNNKIKDISLIASDALHELLHTVKLHHPFEQADAEDTQLVQIGPDEYITTEKTDKNILYNVMNYMETTVNGQNANGALQSSLTYGQIMYILRQIDLQQQGAGLYNTDTYWEDQ